MVKLQITGSDFGLHTSFSSSDKMNATKWLFRNLLMRPFVSVLPSEVQTSLTLTQKMAKELYAVHPVLPA